MRVLLIEDSVRLQTYVAKGLSRHGHAVDIAGDGETGLFMALAEEHDIVILDLMLPKLDGLSLLRRMREQGCNTHVLILTAKDTVFDRVNGLDMGADDYLAKPFAFEELLARVHALVRRQYGNKAPTISAAGLLIDTVRKKALREGADLGLSAREYALLEYLAQRQGHVVTRSEIERHIYNDDHEIMSNVIDSAICLIRRKIDTPGAPSLIQTRRGLGYVFGDGAA